MKQSKQNRWIGVVVLLSIPLSRWPVEFINNKAFQEIEKSQHSEKNGFHFKDITNEMGINFVHHDPDTFDPILKNKLRYLSFGTGVAIADVNGDGWMDILLLSGNKDEKNHLYINQGGKGFIDEAEEWGIADTNQNGGANVSAAFFDYDNDGKPDLYIARMGCSKLFHNTGSRFEDVTQKSGLGDCRNSNSALPIDIDSDGHLDLYVIRYWPNKDYFFLNGDSFVFPENEVDARNGGLNTLYHNNGDGTFTEATHAIQGNENHWALDAVAADLSNEGKTQLYVANDIGPDNLYQLEDKHLINISEKLGIPDRQQGMNASVADLDGTGAPFVFVSNIWNDRYEITGNFLLKFGKNLERENRAMDYHVQNCGWAWGAGFADFDLDGKLDFYVANGFISGPGEELSYTVSSRMASVQNADATNWFPLDGISFAGHQTGCLFMNRGSYFENAASWASPNQPWDGRAVGLIDFDNNGSIDLVISTQDGPAHLLKNEVIPNRNWLGLKLVGVQSNRDGIGARIRIQQNGWTAYRWATGKTGYLAFSDPRIHFGLPKEDLVSIQIDWPSGQSQLIRDVRPGAYYQVTENQNSIQPYTYKQFKN